LVRALVSPATRKRRDDVSGRPAIAGDLADGLRVGTAVLLLTFQAVMIVHARFDDARYFSWAPHDAQNEYVIEARSEGRSLSDEEVGARYRIPARGVDPRAIAHVIGLVEQYETSRGAGGDIEVVVRWRTNGGAERTWRHPDR
jgi:hypothetical protein